MGLECQAEFGKSAVADGGPKVGGGIKLWRRIELEARHSALNLWWRLWMGMVEVAAESVFRQGLWKNEDEERLKIGIVMTRCVGKPGVFGTKSGWKFRDREGTSVQNFLFVETSAGNHRYLDSQLGLHRNSKGWLWGCKSGIIPGLRRWGKIVSSRSA